MNERRYIKMIGLTDKYCRECKSKPESMFSNQRCSNCLENWLNRTVSTIDDPPINFQKRR